MGYSGGVVQIPAIDDAIDIEVGDVGACVITVTHTVRCWGGVANGVGICEPPATPCALPAEIAGLTGVRRVRLGTSHGCALLDDGTMRCWGDNTDGKLGTGTGVDSDLPTPVLDLAHVRDIGLTSATTYALTDNGAVFSWGSNWEGSMGTGAGTQSLTPTPVHW